MLGELPEGWNPPVPLSSCVINKTQKWDGSEVLPYVGLEHIEQKTGRLLGFGDSDSVTSAKTVFEPSDVLFGKLRPNLRKYWKADRRGICSTDVLVLKSQRELLEDYLFAIVQSEPFLVFAENDAAGTKMPRTSWKRLSLIEVAVPPINEQHRIAEILSSVDASIQATQAVIEQAERVKRGLMEELLTGGLGSEAIERGEVPEGWMRCDFSAVFLIRNRKEKQIQKQDYSERGEFPIIDQSSSFIAGYSNGEPNEDYPVVIFGDHTRAVKYIDFPYFSGADGTQALYPVDGINPKFSYYLLRNTELPNLGYSRHMRELKRVDFSIPPLNEQQRIAKILSEADDFITKQRTIIEQQTRTKRGLMGDLLTGKVRTV